MKTKLRLLVLLLICQVANLITFLWCIFSILDNSGRGWKILISYDKLFNTTTGGSDYDTISARAYRGSTECVYKWEIVEMILDWIQPGHCKAAYEQIKNDTENWK